MPLCAFRMHSASKGSNKSISEGSYHSICQSLAHVVNQYGGLTVAPRHVPPPKASRGKGPVPNGTQCSLPKSSDIRSGICGLNLTQKQRQIYDGV